MAFFYEIGAKVTKQKNCLVTFGGVKIAKKAETAPLVHLYVTVSVTEGPSCAPASLVEPTKVRFRAEALNLNKKVNLDEPEMN